MNTKKKNTFIMAGVSSLISLALFLWFTFRPGLIGTLHWHIALLILYIVLLITVLLPGIFALIYLYTDSKVSRILSRSFSISVFILWIVIFEALSILPKLPINAEGLNLLTQKQKLPATESENNMLAKYAFASDPHWGSGKSNADARKNIMKEIDKRGYDAFFCLGDVAEIGMIPSMYQEAVNDIVSSMQNTPMLAIPGNHDAIVNGLPAFKQTFMDKKDKLYFRMDNGTIHLIFIYMLWDDSEFSKRQEKWLVKQLESIPQEDTVIVMSHCYVTGSGYWDSAAQKHWGDIPGVVNTLCPIFEKYNVDLSLSGHNHFFEYLNKEDVNYMILGSMGGKLDEDLIYESPYTQWLNNTDFGWLDVQVYNDFIKLTVFSQYGKVLFEKDISSN